MSFDRIKKKENEKKIIFLYLVRLKCEIKEN